MTVAARSALLFGLLIAGCASTGTVKPPDDVDLLIYESESPPFCGRCDTLKFSLATDGRLWVERGHWAGHYRNWRTRHDLRQATPDQVREAWASVAPFKPGPDAPANTLVCRENAPDLGGARISWRVGGEIRTLVRRDCQDNEAKELGEALDGLPAVLGLKDSQ